MKHFDVIVVGAGHAGVEAALAAHRRGARTALITFSAEDIGVMSCNPAIGGIGKGHLVREIDALGGMMGLAADYAAIQYRLLNRSRGPSVQGPRIQADRKRYRHFAKDYVTRARGLTTIEGEAVEILLGQGVVTGIRLASDEKLLAPAVILTTGTFLRGEIHIGREKAQAGRVGAAAANRLGSFLREIAAGVGRLKTGTPARLDGRTIDWSVVGLQPGDDRPTFMSFLTRQTQTRQISCGVTETNPRTHEIIGENLHLSAMRSGNITGVGPRYCPSVEDKVTRFADKASHNVFLEPEGLDSHLVYPNGLSSSLPRDVQERFLRSIKGLEAVEIAQHGYAIEYDYLDPRGLDRQLQARAVPGLFLAGQINGTTGYEEAGAQGLVAGANAAALALGLGFLDLNRTNSYIGVMIDDLVERGVTEPYRMFTSRSEYRLSLRADNADQRLTPVGHDLGLVPQERFEALAAKQKRIDELRVSTDTARMNTDVATVFAAFGVSITGTMRLIEAAKQMLGKTGHLQALDGHLGDIDLDDFQQVVTDSLYAPYISRQKSEIATLAAENDVSIPEGLDFHQLPSLSAELAGKLTQLRPRTMREARAIEGMTPAAYLVLLAGLRGSKAKRKNA